MTIARRVGCGPVSVGRGESQAQPWSDPSPWRLAGAGGSSHLHRGRELDRGQAGVLAQWAELGRRPAAAGGIAGRSRAGQARDGPSKGWDPAGLQVRDLQYPRAAPQTPAAGAPSRAAVLPARRGRCRPPLSFPGRSGPEVAVLLPARSSWLGGAVGRRGDWTSSGQAWPRPRPPERAQSASRPRRKVRPPQCRSCTASGGLSSSIPAASGCDSGLLGHPGPRAAGAPGRVTRSVPASDPELHPFHCHYKHSGARRAVSPPDR